LDEELNDLREYSRTPADEDALNKKRKTGGENGDAVS
jgi:HIV Tat-specific factor 1